jgi:hypothetical protein
MGAFPKLKRPDLRTNASLDEHLACRRESTTQMNETHHSHHPHGDPNGGHVPHKGPYWTRAHRDWRVWIGVILMLAAMVVYLMSDDLAWRPHIRSQPPLSNVAGK